MQENLSFMNTSEERWLSKWEKMRSKGQLKYALYNAFVVSVLIAFTGFLFVYITNYQLKTSYLNFALVLFFVMFIYKFIKHYYFDWKKNEKSYSELKNNNLIQN